MRVFRMNDYDWVSAENEEQAKEFYEKETGFKKEEIVTILSLGERFHFIAHCMLGLTIFQ